MSLLERIYFFHTQILKNRFPNTGDLMEEFEISEATSRRDISYMRDRLLAPLDFDRDKNGFYYTDRQFRLPFEESPRILLLLGMLHKMATETGLEKLPEINKLQKRLAGLLSEDQRRLTDNIFYEWIEVEEVNTKLFASVISALLHQNQLEITYRVTDGTTTGRLIDPLQLINYQGRWYLSAWCHLRDNRRMFHLGRMSEATVTTKKTRHKPEKESSWLTRSFGIFKGDKVEKATIKLTGNAAEIVSCQRWHKEQIIKKTDDGIILTLPVADHREIIMKILQYGAQAEVISPDSLRNSVINEIQSMITRYQPA